MLKIAGVKGGIEIKPKEPTEMEISGSKALVYGLEVYSPLLNEVLGFGSSTVTWVGRKHDGIYIGFKETQMKKLEQMAEKTFGVKPRETLEQKENTIQNC